ncbi:MAG: DUF1566 domain-containing protein [Gammaproteobacteria bacterium]|nr:DUF1566 domain-containing protein [Gammaproteobacteria bacterium]MDH5730036.1 DUF1566 domain-containing protein [Gammaproteobacteria bacterium]
MSSRHLVPVLLLFLLGQNPLWAACDYNIAGRSENRFVNLQDGTVVDRMTGLQWQRCDLGRAWDTASQRCSTTASNDNIAFNGNWNDALQAVNTMNNSGGFAGRSDWRLPNVKELGSIVMYHCNPVIDTSIFLEPNQKYWSATPSRNRVSSTINVEENNQAVQKLEYRDAAWQVNFVDGADDIVALPINQNGSVRVVRGPVNLSQINGGN